MSKLKDLSKKNSKWWGAKLATAAKVVAFAPVLLPLRTAQVLGGILQAAIGANKLAQRARRGRQDTPASE